MRELHLFAGAGGGILGGLILGHKPVGAVELDDYCRRVLKARQNDGTLPRFPIHADIRDFDGRAWRGRVDVVAGGFPCQDLSVAGKGAGLDGDRSGLWWEMHRVIREVGPRYVFVENVPALLVRGFDRVLGSLAELRFDAEWCVLSAADCGAPHLRKRLWLLAAHPERDELREQPGRLGGAHGQGSTEPRDDGAQGSDRERRGWWEVEPSVGRVVDGVPNRVHRLRALGNAQVPLVAAHAWRTLMKRSHPISEAPCSTTCDRMPAIIAGSHAHGLA